MGVNLSAVTSFKKIPKSFYLPVVKSSFVYQDHHCDQYYDVFIDSFCYTSMSHSFDDPDFSPSDFERYTKYAQSFLESITTLEDNDLKVWLLSQKGLFIGFSGDQFWSAETLSEEIREVWSPDEFAGLNEDCRLLMNAIQNMKHLYDIDVSDCFISYDQLGYTDEDNLRSLQARFDVDVIQLATQAQEKLVTIQKREDDEFFDERLPRFQLILDALKQGAHLLYQY